MMAANAPVVSAMSVGAKRKPSSRPDMVGQERLRLGLAGLVREPVLVVWHGALANRG